MTVRQALTEATEELKEADTETPYLDAVLLLCSAIEVSKEQLFALLPETLATPSHTKFKKLIERRGRGVPVAYLRGKKEFFGREFTVDERVLVPRPDTETLVEAALDIIDTEGGSLRVHDCCTGSGCVAITIQAERPRCNVSGSDISSDALDVASQNARMLLGGELPFYVSDLLSNVPERYDIITANPPYVTSDEVVEMRHRGCVEPELALDGGSDGLNTVRRLIGAAVESLARNGYICVETADPQAPLVRRIMKQAGFADVDSRNDLAGKRRVTVGRKLVLADDKHNRRVYR